MDGTTIAIVGIIVMIALLLLGMNIGTSMILVGFLGCLILSGQASAESLLGTIVMSRSMTYSFTVCPLFILMGHLIYQSGLSAELFNAADAWLGSVKGGMAMAAVIACGAFGAICGSLSATVATMTLIALPEMKKAGYSNKLAAGATAAGGTLGVLIPPSTNFIMYGVTAEESIGQLFAGGIVAGIINIVFFCIVIFIITKIHPDWAPKTHRTPIKEKFTSLAKCLPVVIIFVVVIGGMLTGVFSSTEAAAIGAVLGFLMLIIRKQFTWKAIKAAVSDTVHTSAMVLWMMLGAYLFNAFLTLSKLPQEFANIVLGASLNKYVIIAMIIVIYAILGCILDAMAMMLLTVPIFLPIVTGLGYSGIWFGVVIVLVMNLGCITPPVGLASYVCAGVAKNVSDVTLADVFSGALPMCLAIVAVVIVAIAFPDLITWLPNLVKG